MYKFLIFFAASCKKQKIRPSGRIFKRYHFFLFFSRIRIMANIATVATHAVPMPGTTGASSTGGSVAGGSVTGASTPYASTSVIFTQTALSIASKSAVYTYIPWDELWWVSHICTVPHHTPYEVSPPRGRSSRILSHRLLARI